MLWWTLRKLRSPKPIQRLAAVRQLRGRKTPEVIAALGRCLGDRSSMVQSAAFDALASVGAIEKAQAIDLFTKGWADVQLRVRAIREVAKYHNPAEATALADLVLFTVKFGFSGDNERTIVKEALEALQAVDAKWKTGPPGRRLLGALWERFSAASYLGVEGSVLPVIASIDADWIVAPESARALNPLMAYVGDGSLNADWELRTLVKLARTHCPNIVAGLSSTQWTIRRGASAVLHRLFYAAYEKARPKNYWHNIGPEESGFPIGSLVTPLIEALRTPRSAKAASELLGLFLRHAARVMEDEHLSVLAGIEHVAAIKYDDYMVSDVTVPGARGDNWKGGEEESPITIDFGPASQARQELARRGIGI
jgi:hypothetical protein